MRLFELLKRSSFAFAGDKRGGVAVEYTLIATGISVVIAGAVFSIGGILKDDYFNEIVAAFTG